MKITDASINNPREVGVYQNPTITLTVDEPVYEIAEPVFDPKKSLAWRLVPCGPFYAAEFRPNTGLITWIDFFDLGPMSEYRRCEYDTAVPDIGELNELSLIKDQLMPVMVRTPDEEVDLLMAVPRVRRLIRKHVGFEWEVTVDEQAALLGLLKWRLELSKPVCYGGAMPGEAHCTRQPNQTIVYRGTHLTLCHQHALSYEGRMRKTRALTNNR